jgi:kumamolisin
VLYAIPTGAGALRDTTVGDNSVPASRFGPATSGYQATPGWDACTGLGSIDGSALLQQLRPASLVPPAPAVEATTV